MKKTSRNCFVLLLLIAAPSVMLAQVDAPRTPPPAPPPAAPQPAPVAVDSPRAAYRAFLEAARAARWDDAARYLALPPTQAARGAELARRLDAVIDSRLTRLDPDSISGLSQGRLDDQLPADVEEIATIDNDGVSEPLRFVRTTQIAGVPWRFTPATVERIDEWYAHVPGRWFRDTIIDAGFPGLLRAGPFDILWWQWLVLPFIALLAWAMGTGLRVVGKPLMDRITAHTSTQWDDHLASSLGPPVTLAFAVVVFAVGVVVIGLSRTAVAVVAPFLRATTTVALFWGLWRSTAVLIAWAMTRSWATSNASARNLLAIGSNISRGIIVGLGLLSVLASLGYPVGTVLAGLGIGGLALAFGAQKTVENLFGSVSLAADQPFRVGDFVRVDNFVGTVEDIGIRSTRFRTLDRTLVTIPNGKLADQRLESLDARDRMRLDTTVSLTYGTTRAQMEQIISGIEKILTSHPRIWPDGITVKFKALGQSSLDIEVSAWFQVPTWGQFQVCRQEVLLAFMDVVEQAGSSFAFPTRTVHLVQQPAPGGVREAQA